MINKPPPFKGLNIRIPSIIPIKGRGFINQGSALVVGRMSGMRRAISVSLQKPHAEPTDSQASSYGEDVVVLSDM